MFGHNAQNHIWANQTQDTSTDISSYQAWWRKGYELGLFYSHSSHHLLVIDLTTTPLKIKVF